MLESKSLCLHFYLPFATISNILGLRDNNKYLIIILTYLNIQINNWSNKYIVYTTIELKKPKEITSHYHFLGRSHSFTLLIEFVICLNRITLLNKY